MLTKRIAALGRKMDVKELIIWSQNIIWFTDQKIWTKSNVTENLIHNNDISINTKEYPLIRSMSTT